jgi:hypothetical protein
MGKDISGVSARQQAENELREDERKANVTLFKSKLKELKAAKRVVKNIELDLAELEEELKDG